MTSPGECVHFRTALLTDAGGRDTNQDSCTWQITGSRGCWVVADGLGGHKAGGIASNAAIQAVLESFRAHEDCTYAALEQHFTAAQSALHNIQARTPEFATMRTTLVVLLADTRKAIWGHIGDSRLYHFRLANLLECTEDHSVAQALIAAGELSAEAIRGHADRNRLFHSLGQPGPAEATIRAEPIELHAGDAFLLCTDGFWEYVLESELAADLAGAKGPEDWLGQAQQKLLKKASSRCDNYSALAVLFYPPPDDGLGGGC